APAIYQVAAFPFAALFHYLCTSRSLSINARYIYLLVGGFLLAFAAMGRYALLLLLSAFCSLGVIHSAGPQKVHKRAFFFQMSWQTLCHLWLHYKEYYLQEAAGIRLPVALSALMLMTQRVTSLALDIHERKMSPAWPGDGEKEAPRGDELQALSFCTYLLSFPTLLGGPLCSFNRFQTWIRSRRTPCSARSLRAAAQRGLGALLLSFLRDILGRYVCPQDDLAECTHFGCIYAMWTSALFFRLTYYSHWMLDESLFLAAGLGQRLAHGPHAETEDQVLLDTHIWTLETTNRIAAFTRTWNKSTAQWLRRLIFQRRRSFPLLATFAFSAWWHGLHPGQVFGFLCWAVMVEADYRFHHFFGSVAKSQPQRWLYQLLTWCHTQLVMAYVMIAVETRSLSMLWWLCSSYSSFFPLVYAVSLLLLAKRKVSSHDAHHPHTSHP
ncbi:Ghrelin O-acyltransferase, partial [Varanus komodoensis]